MNIFFISLIPRYCARYHCDKHVVKMIVECCQMMWTAYHLTGRNGWENKVPNQIKIYKKTNPNHPMCIWVRSDKANFRWTVELASELCKQYTKRYGKIHACEAMIKWFSKNTPQCNETIKAKKGTLYSKYNYPEGCTPPPLCTGNLHYKSRDLVKVYRSYYIDHKAEFAKWNYSKTPYWWK